MCSPTSSPPPDSYPICPTPRSTVARHPPNACPVSENLCHPQSKLPPGRFSGCVASTVFKGFPDLVKVLEGRPTGRFSKTIKHGVCSEYRRCNTSPLDPVNSPCTGRRWKTTCGSTREKYGNTLGDAPFPLTIHPPNPRSKRGAGE
jgi:hypothetical protein